MRGGGAFLLTLSVIAGVCLVTLPVKTTVSAAENNPITSLTDDGTIKWRVVELDGNQADNAAKISAIPKNEPYVKYLLQADWQINAGIGGDYGVFLPGQYIVLDLQGHTISIKGNFAVSGNGATVFEITDSSADGAGVLSSQSAGFSPIRGAQTTIISGGKLTGVVGKDFISKLIMVGGTLEGTTTYPVFYWGEPDYLFLPNYVSTGKMTDRAVPVDYRTGTNTTSASFAVYGAKSSNGRYASGNYNYAYSTLTENFGPGDCILEKMTNPHWPHYLLYRANPTAAYQVLATL